MLGHFNQQTEHTQLFILKNVIEEIQPKEFEATLETPHLAKHGSIVSSYIWVNLPGGNTARNLAYFCDRRITTRERERNLDTYLQQNGCHHAYTWDGHVY